MKKSSEKQIEKPKVIIALAVQDTVKTKLCLSLLNALHHADFDYDVVARMGCDLIGARTGLVRQAQALGGTHLLFVDHDMFLNPTILPDGKREDPITTLLKRNKDVIAAPYNYRSLPLKSTAFPMSDISDKTQPFRCQALGTGFMLIKMSVFDKIAKPWFNFGRDSDAELVYGEDTWFCQQVIKAGMEVWADPTVNITHIGDFDY